MKKLLALVLVCMMLFVAAFTIGCDREREEDYSGRVNYYQTALYVGESDSLYVQLACGKKEKDYMIDGIISEMTDFATLTITPMAPERFVDGYSYSLIGPNGTREGSAPRDVFGTAYRVEVGDFSAIGGLTAIKLTAGENSYEIPLVEQMAGKLGYSEVLALARAEFSAEIAAEVAGDGFAREITIKYVNDSRNTASPYYWYIAFIKSVDDYWAMLVEPSTGRIITKRTAS